MNWELQLEQNVHNRQFLKEKKVIILKLLSPNVV